MPSGIRMMTKTSYVGSLRKICRVSPRVRGDEEELLECICTKSVLCES